MPGERLGDENSPVMKLILAMQEFGRRFPGFERETHGIEIDAEGQYWMRAVVEGEHRPEPEFVDRPEKQLLESKPIRRSTS
jgi:arginine decarboxylase